MLYPTPVGCLNIDAEPEVVPSPGKPFEVLSLRVLMQVGPKPLRFVNFPGLAWRSVFGYALRTLTCLSHDAAQCQQECVRPDICLYGRIFNPPRRTDPARGFQDPPRPYVIKLPKPSIGLGLPFTRYDLVINLIGEATRAAEAVLAAVKLAVERGIGPDRAKLSVFQDLRTWVEPSNTKTPAESLTIEFLTPTQLRVDSRLVQSPEFVHIIRGILRRVFPLAHLYGQPLEAKADDIIESARAIRIERSDVCWYELERQVRRPEKRMNLSGFAGTVRYVGDIGPFLPWLHLGSILNIGKHATFGMGDFEVHP